MNFDPRKQWTDSKVPFPITVLCGFIFEQGRLEINEQQQLKQWNQLTQDTQGWWNYHNKTNGNLHQFLHDVVIPNMNKRLKLLPNPSTPIGRLISYIVNYMQQTRYT